MESTVRYCTIIQQISSEWEVSCSEVRMDILGWRRKERYLEEKMGWRNRGLVWVMGGERVGERMIGQFRRVERT